MTLPAQRSGPDAEWGGPDQLCYGPPAADPLRPTRPTRPVTAAPAGLAEFAARATALLGAGRVLADRTSLGLHSYDASLEVRQPGLVLIPRHAADLAALVTDAARIGVPWVMRGAGTGYSGGALAEHGGAVVLTRDLNRILEIDPDRRLVRCEPGVVLGDLREALRPYGLRYLPDPSSYQVCTLGGNVAENAGGPHALGSGPTSNFVVGLDLILPDGSPATLTEADVWQGGLDLRSLLVGSEGTLGAVGAMTLRVVPEPECSQVLIARFEEQDPAAATVEVLLAGGLLPSALDMITGAYVPDRPALRDPSLLFIALEGTTAEVRHQAAVAEAAVAAAGGSSELLAVDAFMAVRARLVKEKVRRMVTTGGRPCYYLFDAVVPRSGLKKLMGALRRRADQHGFPLLNTFHAADGNVHPTPFYDPADPGYRDGLLAFLRDVLSDCAELGGSLSGEHGVGLEKREHMPLFHTERELTVMRRIKAAVDPGQVCNPGKILPEPAPEGAPHRIGRRHPDPQGGAALRVRVADGAIDVRDRRVTFGEIDRALAGSGLELPYEPLGAGPDTSVLDALDRGGPALREPLTVRARDLILATELRSAQGRPLATGGSCTKDVSGYELRKLAFGGRGRIGQLVAASLRLLPRASDRRSLTVPCDGPAEAGRLCRALHEARLPFVSLGVLTDAQGDVSVTGLLETRGGSLDEPADRMRTAFGLPLTESRSAARWEAAPVRAFAGYAELSHLPGQPWHLVAELERLRQTGSPGFAAVGTPALWFPRDPAEPTEPPVPTLLARVAEAFGDSAWT